MIRSKIDEIKFLRSNHFVRPTTSNFLTPSKKFTFKMKDKKGQYRGKATPVVSRSPMTFASPSSRTPESSRSGFMTCLNYSASPEASFPYKVHDFLERFRNLISRHETVEALDYYIVYYWGKSQKNTHFFRYDDEKGFLICDTNDHIAYRFQIIGEIGKGTFGQVFEAFDHKEKNTVAVKIIRNQKKFIAQGNNEVKILKLIKENSNIKSFCIDLKDYFIFRNHIVLVLELFPSNLLEHLKFNHFKGLSEEKTRSLVIQVLSGLKLLKKLRIIHSDLKPENLLINSTEEVRIIDFGSSCVLNEKINSYVQSRNYRAPEVALGTCYDFQIDIWSLGCILFEVFTGFVLFPCASELELLHRIWRLKGKFPLEMLQESIKFQYFFDGNELKDLDYELVLDYQHFFLIQTRYPLMFDFLNRCLEVDPKKRITVDEASFHLWIKGRRDDSRKRGYKLRCRS